MVKSFSILLLLLPFVFFNLATAAGGQWQLLQKSTGVSAMHMQLLNNDRVIIFDRTDFGRSNLSLPNGVCRRNPNDLALKVDCTAHSIEYDAVSNTVRALMVQTDTWCSSGSVAPDGKLVQTGGFNDGARMARVLEPCSGCDWKEMGNTSLGVSRWYATNQILPDGRQIIIGGRRQFNYEFYPKTTASVVFSLPFLSQTNDPSEENNLYPFVHLNVDGNLFIFANNRSILFNHVSNKVVRTYPVLPGGDPRNYPSSGSSVLLPFDHRGPATDIEVLVCGGAPRGSFAKADFERAVGTCGRIKINDPNPAWLVESMPMARVMSDMVVLPNRDVVLINGAGAGTAGWLSGRDPILKPVIYHPGNPIGNRFETQNPTTMPRMYHSTAVLLRDGSVLVGGSNPNVGYTFTGVSFPTDLSLEKFSPSYLDAENSALRPKILLPASQTKLAYSQRLAVRFSITGTLPIGAVEVTMAAPSFTTHSNSMNQRLVVVGRGKVLPLGNSTYAIQAIMPSSGNFAPPGYYLLFVVHQRIPSEGIWVKLQ